MEIIRSLDVVFPPETTVAAGFFDGVHIGHRAVIEAAKRFRTDKCPLVVFSFTADSKCPMAKRGAKWLTDFSEKARRLENIGVDILFAPPFEAIADMSPVECAGFIAERLNARAVSCGEDYRFGKNAGGTADELSRALSERNIDVNIVPAVFDGGEAVSSSRIRALLLDGEAEEAARLMGEPFTLNAEVVHGRALGRTIGFPTANQRFDDNLIVPRYGVYAARVFVDGKAYSAVSNIGVKPTVGDVRPGSESTLAGFSGDLYGKTVRTQFVSFLRPERKFDSLEALTAQIARDAKRAAEVVGKPDSEA